MPCLTTWAPFVLRNGFAHVDNAITKMYSKQSHGCSCQGCKATNHTGTLQNLPNPPSTSIHRNLPGHSTTFQNLPLEPTPAHNDPPELSGTLGNLPEPTPAHNGALKNLPTGTSPPPPPGRNPPELSGTFRNPSPEPTPAHNGTLEPSGTCLQNLILRPAPAHTGAYLD